MPYKDFHEFLEALRAHDELLVIKTKVSVDLEITEITDRISKGNRKALLFENVSKSNFPVVTNAFGSERKMEIALNDKIENIQARIKELLEPKIPGSFLEKIKVLFKLKELSGIKPKLVSSAKCQETILSEPNLDIMPALKCWPEDGGRFITLPLVFTKSLKTGIRNIGMYRVQIFDNKTTGMHWHINKDGYRHFLEYKEQNKKMEVAIVIGVDPVTIYVSTAPLPPDFDELLFAGFLRKKCVEIVKCKTIDMEVPANADFVIEGYIDPNESRDEGPFGDHTGFYSPQDSYPIFHATCITHREDAIYPATIVGKPPMEDCYMAKVTERLFLPVIQMAIPEILDMNLPIVGVFHNCAIVSIDKTYPYQAKKVMHGMWGIGQLATTKSIIVVDSDVDVHNLNDVAWKAFNNVDPKRDIIITSGPLDTLDHAAENPLFGSKIGIDATRKIKGETERAWPQEIKMEEEIIKLVDKKWKEYGIS